MYNYFGARSAVYSPPIRQLAEGLWVDGKFYKSKNCQLFSGRGKKNTNRGCKKGAKT